MTSLSGEVVHATFVVDPDASFDLDIVVRYLQMRLPSFEIFCRDGSGVERCVAAYRRRQRLARRLGSSEPVGRHVVRLLGAPTPQSIEDGLRAATRHRTVRRP